MSRKLPNARRWMCLQSFENMTRMGQCIYSTLMLLKQTRQTKLALRRLSAFVLPTTAPHTFFNKNMFANTIRYLNLFLAPHPVSLIYLWCSRNAFHGTKRFQVPPSPQGDCSQTKSPRQRSRGVYIYPMAFSES